VVVAVGVSFCIVNTAQRELLVRCLDAVAVERAALAADDVDSEVLVLDNASGDGSVGAARAHRTVDAVIVNRQRRGKSENDTLLLQRAQAPFALLLNEDSELRPGATAELLRALREDGSAGAAGARLLRPDGTPQACAWRFPTVATALAGALCLHRIVTVQSKGSATRGVDWAQSAALLVRTEAATQIQWFDPQFFVYSDEVDFCKRLAQAGWRTLFVPGAVAVHHEQLSTDIVPEKRIVELSRNRDRYMRKHHSRAAAWAVRWLTAYTYFVRSLVAVVLPRHDPRRYRHHVRATLRPQEGEGLREAAYEHDKGEARV